jgi:cytochrome P450
MPDEGFVHPFSAEGWQDPYPAYRWLAEYDPLHQDEHSGAVLLTRHADCNALLRSRRAVTAQAERGTRLPSSMLTTDPPEHTRLRAYGARLISPATVSALAPALQRETDEVLAAAGDRFEAYADVGVPLATAVLALLLDVPSDDRVRLEELAQAASVNLDPLSASRAGQQAAAMLAFYLRSRLRVSESLAAWAAGAGCSEADAVGVLTLCVIGGFEPLAVSAATALLGVATSSALRAAVRGGETARCVEELLRLDTPIPFVARTVSADLPLPSGTLHGGTRVLALIAAANRDPAVFAGSSGDRDGAAKHLAFGAGPHVCLGAPAVRLATTLLLERAVLLDPPLRAVEQPHAVAGSLIPRRFAAVHLRRG